MKKYLPLLVISLCLTGCYFWQGDGLGSSPAQDTAVVAEEASKWLPFPFNYIFGGGASILGYIALRKKK